MGYEISNLEDLEFSRLWRSIKDFYSSVSRVAQRSLSLATRFVVLGRSLTFGCFKSSDHDLKYSVMATKSAIASVSARQVGSIPISSKSASVRTSLKLLRRVFRRCEKA